MHVRLLLDTVLPEEEFDHLAELIAAQPAVVLDGLGTILGARLVGAQLVRDEAAPR